MLGERLDDAAQHVLLAERHEALPLQEAPGPVEPVPLARPCRAGRRTWRSTAARRARCAGALRNHSSLNARMVDRLSRPIGTGGRRQRSGAASTPRSRRRRRSAGRSARVAKSPWVSTERPRLTGRGPAGRSTPPSSGSAGSPSGSRASRVSRSGTRSVSTSSWLVSIGLEVDRGLDDRAGEAHAAAGGPELVGVAVRGERAAGAVGQRQHQRARRGRRSVPAAWWSLPWTSAAMAPPIVTYLVPGVTGTNQPCGHDRRAAGRRATCRPGRVTMPVAWSRSSTPPTRRSASTTRAAGVHGGVAVGPARGPGR